MSKFPYTIAGDYQANQPAVYIITFAKKVFIWKGKALVPSLDSNCKDIYRMQHNGIKPDHSFAGVVRYIIRYRILRCSVEVALQTEDPRALLAKEQELLDQYQGTPDCLNTKFVAHVPAWMQKEFDTAHTGHLKAPDESVAKEVIESVAVEPEIKPDRLAKLGRAFRKLKDAEKKDSHL